MEINKYFDIHFERADDATIAKRLIGGAKIKGPALVILTDYDCCFGIYFIFLYFPRSDGYI